MHNFANTYTLMQCMERGRVDSPTPKTVPPRFVKIFKRVISSAANEYKMNI